MSNPKPLVSVIIPTFNRPQFLPRAINSALEGMDDKDIEVIVIPNGKDRSWQDALKVFFTYPQVRISPIDKAHANAARNHGLKLANGKYVRFLDDDDYLIASGAIQQYQMLEVNQAECCSGLLLSADKNDDILRQISLPNTEDFICACLSISGFTLPVGNVFLKDALQRAIWDENIDRQQDNAWMMRLAGLKEWNWSHCDTPVGVWFQHDGHRTSTVRTACDNPKPIVQIIFDLYELLNREKRLTDERRLAIANALWHYAHRFFPFSPAYWNDVARQARRISKASKPTHPLFTNPVLSRFDPFILEWAMLPLRRASHFLRNLKGVVFGFDYRRTL